MTVDGEGGSHAIRRAGRLYGHEFPARRHRQIVRWRTGQAVVRLLLVLVRPLHPKKRLNVDHIAWPQVPKIARAHPGKFEKVGVALPVRTRPVLKIKTVLASRRAGDHRLEKKM